MSGTQAGGSGHWRRQRLTSVVLLPLGIWFLFALLSLPELSHATVTGWLRQPMQALLAALAVAVSLWHSAQGWQVVLEDYVGGKLLAPALRISRLLHLVAAIAGVGAVIATAAGAA